MTAKPTAPLVNVGGARALTGWAYDRIFKMVDGGDLIDSALVWVWNFAADPQGEIRDLRFWRDELEAFPGKPRCMLDQVIKRILSDRRQNFHAGEVVEMFTLTRPSLMVLRKDLGGELQAGGSFFTRTGLEKFLRSRWLGNQSHQTAAIAGMNTLEAAASKINGAASPAALSLSRRAA